jgi:glycosyltransferase involved in cell wall biosynthesis
VFLPLIERYAINTADKINLVSRGFKKYFKDRYDKEYSFFPNGIDDIFLNFEPSAGVKFDNKKLIFTYTGNIGEGQGLEKIVPGIADRYKNIELRIIGAGGRASTLKVAVDGRDNVKMINPVSREKLHEFYSESDVLFLQLNDYEAFKKVLPSKIFEYGATYKPIIAGVGGYAKEFLEEYLPDCVIYRPCDLEDFCEKYNNMSFRVDIDRRKSFIEHFSRKHIMADMAKDFLTIVQKNKNK